MYAIVPGILLVLVIIYAVPFLFYGACSFLGLVKAPAGDSPGRFLLSVLVTKAGTAIAFVLIFFFAREAFGGRWVLYGSLWWVAGAIGELGEAVKSSYSWREAMIGIVSEGVYFPAGAAVTDWLLAPG